MKQVPINWGTFALLALMGLFSCEKVEAPRTAETPTVYYEITHFLENGDDEDENPQVFGRVMTLDGTGISEAHVELCDAQNEANTTGSAVTDTEGRYKIQAPKGAYTLRTSLPGHTKVIRKFIRLTGDMEVNIYVE